MEECNKLINLRREAYYIKVKNRQIFKLVWLCHRNRGGHPNIQHGRHDRQDLTDPNSPSSNTETSDGNREPGTDMSKRWVVNLSSQPLTEAESKLLAHGLNFNVTSRSPHYRMCYHHRRDLPETGKRWSRKVKGEVKAILKNAHPPKPNITRTEGNGKIKKRWHQDNAYSR